jgi:hypothetical protein
VCVGARVADRVGGWPVRTPPYFSLASDSLRLSGLFAAGCTGLWRTYRPLAIQQFARHLSGVVRQRTQLRTYYMSHAAGYVRYSAHEHRISQLT